MATVAAPTQKSNKAYYAHLYDLAGVLTKVDGTLYFMVPETGAITEVEPDMVNFLTVLGSVEPAMAQWCTDMQAGGYAAVCTSREEGVR